MNEESKLSTMLKRFSYVIPDIVDQELAVREWTSLKLESVETKYLDPKSNKQKKVSAVDFWTKIFSLEKANGELNN
jgi:hypothetical protein